MANKTRSPWNGPETTAEWRQQSRFMSAPRYELVRGESVLATLEWRSAFGTLATAMADGTSWTFKRTGFWSPRITIRREGSDEDEAVFRRGGVGGVKGELRWPSGEALELRRVGFWSISWQLVTPERPEEPLVSVSDMGGFFRRRATLSMPTPGDARMPLAACFLWYLIVLMTQDSGSVFGGDGGDGDGGGDGGGD